jgi:hypothetical protein
MPEISDLATRLRRAFAAWGLRSLGDEAAGQIERISTLHPREAWHEDYGDVLWHHLDEYGGICEAPIVSRGDDELDGHQPWENYYAYWSHLPRMEGFPLRAAMLAPEHHKILICDEWEFVDA